MKVNMPSAHWVFDNRAVEFSVEADGRTVICWISWQTLADHFGATHETALDVLLANLDEIAPVAEKVYRARSPDERVVVTTEDF